MNAPELRGAVHALEPSRATGAPGREPEPNAETFMAKFARYWSAPSVAGMRELLTDDVVLIQPLSRTTRGLVEGQAAFSKIFRWVPDLRAHQLEPAGKDESKPTVAFSRRLPTPE